MEKSTYYLMLPRLYPELIWLKMRNAQELLVEVSDVKLQQNL
jgi:hypothetical protein